jgi:hypothetical protein
MLLEPSTILSSEESNGKGFSRMTKTEKIFLSGYPVFWRRK